MGTLHVFIYYGGRWDETNGYHDYSVCGLIVPVVCSYEDLIRLISIQLEKELNKHDFVVQYQAMLNGPRIRILNDYSLAFYLDLKKGETDKRIYPLCVDVTMSNVISETSQDDAMHQTDHEANESGTTVLQQFDSSDPFSMTLVPRLPSVEEMGMELAEHINVHDEDTGNISSIVVNRPNPDEVIVGRVFKNKEVLITSVSLFAIKNRFQFKVSKSDQKIYTTRCLDEGCNWRFRSSICGLTGSFKIRKMSDSHGCCNDTILGKNRHASSLVIASCIKYRFFSTRRIYTPGDIIEDMHETYGVTVSYDKAWRSREQAIKIIRGDPAESYGNIPSYMYMTELTNPGSYTRVETDECNRFLFSFMALGASIEGWKHCKPVIVVDGTFLTSRYRGTLFTACTQDANNNIFILAFGVGDGENNNAWEWFMTRLREAYGEREGLCIVSDRHGSIEHAAEKVFPNAMHGACTYHLLQNLRKRFGKKGKGIRIPFNAAARAYTKNEFEANMSILDTVDPGIRGYLKKAGYERWSRSHMTTDRYSTMTSNIVESVNSAIKHAKKYPIEALLECLRCTIQKWFFQNLSDARSTFTRLATRHNAMLNERVKSSLRIRVNPSNDIVYQVNDDTATFVVNMEERTCSCRRFQLDHMPCEHAVAVISKMNYSLSEYCSSYFTKEEYIQAYQGTIYPLGNKEEWYIPAEVTQKIVLPPIAKRGPGRPRENRYKSSIENKKRSRCRKCDNYGHNSRTCGNPASSVRKATKKRKTPQ